ncbi:hypothetical protein L7F22_020135 [Adiantum nelumboides]|nr:hypothetical protein [Adiantum nelumboides]
MDFVLLTDSGEPSCYKEAMLANAKVQWEHAMKRELSNIAKNKTWELVPLPKDRKAFPCKWVYKKKIASNVENYKARLVAKGFKQEYGVDFQEIDYASCVDNCKSTIGWIYTFAGSAIS